MDFELSTVPGLLRLHGGRGLGCGHWLNVCGNAVWLLVGLLPAAQYSLQSHCGSGVGVFWSVGGFVFYLLLVWQLKWAIGGGVWKFGMCSEAETQGLVEKPTCNKLGVLECWGRWGRAQVHNSHPKLREKYWEIPTQISFYSVHIRIIHYMLEIFEMDVQRHMSVNNRENFTMTRVYKLRENCITLLTEDALFDAFLLYSDSSKNGSITTTRVL